MTDKRMDKNIEVINRQKGEKVFQMITLIALPFSGPDTAGRFTSEIRITFPVTRC